jgi:hypothetical protein
MNAIQKLSGLKNKQKKLRGLSPQANYTNQLSDRRLLA